MASFIKIAAGAAVLVSSFIGLPGAEMTPLGASEAQAGSRDYRHRRHGDNFDFGDAVVGAVVVGGLIAVLSGASRKKREQEENRPLDSGWKPGGDWDRDSGDWSWTDRDWQNRTGEERAAIGACAREAEDLGGRYEREARVREIGGVDREGGEYRVKGRVETRRGGDSRDGADAREFICYVRGDRITDFRFLEA